MCNFLIMFSPPCVELGFCLVEFQALNTQHYYEMNIVVWLISLTITTYNLIL